MLCCRLCLLLLRLHFLFRLLCHHGRRCFAARRRVGSKKKPRRVVVAFFKDEERQNARGEVELEPKHGLVRDYVQPPGPKGIAAAEGAAVAAAAEPHGAVRHAPVAGPQPHRGLGGGGGGGGEGSVPPRLRVGGQGVPQVGGGGGGGLGGGGGERVGGGLGGGGGEGSSSVTTTSTITGSCITTGSS